MSDYEIVKPGVSAVLEHVKREGVNLFNGIITVEYDIQAGTTYAYWNPVNSASDIIEAGVLEEHANTVYKYFQDASLDKSFLCVYMINEYLNIQYLRLIDTDGDLLDIQQPKIRG